MNYSERMQKAKRREDNVNEALDTFINEAAGELPDMMHCIDILPNIIDEILGFAYEKLQQSRQYNINELIEIIEAKHILKTQPLSYTAYDIEEAGVFLETCAKCIEDALCTNEVFYLEHSAETHKLFDLIIKIAEEYKENTERLD